MISNFIKKHTCSILGNGKFARNRDQPAENLPEDQRVQDTAQQVQIGVQSGAETAGRGKETVADNPHDGCYHRNVAILFRRSLTSISFHIKVFLPIFSKKLFFS